MSTQKQDIFQYYCHWDKEYYTASDLSWVPILDQKKDLENISPDDSICFTKKIGVAPILNKHPLPSLP